MINNLIVLIESRHRSFCYYEIPEECTNKLISLDNLQKVAKYSNEHQIPITFIYGDSELPNEYSEVIDSVQHSNILSFSRDTHTNSSVLVVESSDKKAIGQRGVPAGSNCILRIKKSELGFLDSFLESSHWNFSRVSLILRELHTFSEDDYLAYWTTLEHIALKLPQIFMQKGEKELSALTDQIVLRNMNNCNAGSSHLTLAPDGQLYVCPGFYYDFPDNSLGTLDDFSIPNQQLYEVDHAPVCLECDAYHCKRCVYMHKKSTGEVNTPGREECVASHVERRASQLLARNINPISEAFPVPDIDYIDPFEKFARKRNIHSPHIDMKRLKKALYRPTLPEDPRTLFLSQKKSKETESNTKHDNKEIVHRIYEMQKKITSMQEEILDLLKYMRGI